ncbi:RPB7 [Enterospora canceri]|uniref:RPB7 n=1 Tax=Enterospora canceri TaxID=1081671 RepID=A0A1Y1S923_9MICR|nr:RPB7 [Enterospora canceri]
MFMKKVFTQVVNLSPQYIGANMHGLVRQYLIENVEGTCSPHGFTITVVDVRSISEGAIMLNGYTKFRIEYEALVLNPVRGEVVEAPIVSANKMGYFASVGPLSIFISTYQIPAELQNTLAANDTVRLRIIGTKADSEKIYAIGTLKDECLGAVV